MEAIRNIQTVNNGEIRLHLPKQFWGREVEIIVLSAPLSSTQAPTAKKSLRGCLKPLITYHFTIRPGMRDSSPFAKGGSRGIYQ